MSIHVLSIEAANLPIYTDGIWHGGEVVSSHPAPLLATYRVRLSQGGTVVDLHLEIRQQPSGLPLVDEYHEDELGRVLLPLVGNVPKKERARRYNRLVERLGEMVLSKHLGEPPSWPTVLEP